MRTPVDVIPTIRGIDTVHAAIAETTIPEALVKSYRWLTLIAALLITLCEVLVFRSQATQAGYKRANVAVGAEVDGRRHAPGVEPWRLVKPRVQPGSGSS
jgi:hypothetical protein